MICVIFFFFFKQKTAYEMRISDWSSDVCSSDLATLPKSIEKEALTLEEAAQLIDARAAAAPAKKGRKAAAKKPAEKKPPAKKKAALQKVAATYATISATYPSPRTEQKSVV